MFNTCIYIYIHFLKHIGLLGSITILSIKKHHQLHQPPSNKKSILHAPPWALPTGHSPSLSQPKRLNSFWGPFFWGSWWFIRPGRGGGYWGDIPWRFPMKRGSIYFTVVWIFFHLWTLWGFCWEIWLLIPNICACVFRDFWRFHSPRWTPPSETKSIAIHLSNHPLKQQQWLLFWLSKLVVPPNDQRLDTPQ